MARPRTLVSALLGALLLSASAAMAQESDWCGRNEVSVQGTGFFTKDSPLPWSVFKLNPFVLAGAGALVFDPTGNARQSVPGALSQTKAAFVYGGGVDFAVSKHVAVRAEYRGFVYNRPDFGLDPLDSNVTTHTAQPSAGLVFRF